MSNGFLYEEKVGGSRSSSYVEGRECPVFMKTLLCEDIMFSKYGYIMGKNVFPPSENTFTQTYHCIHWVLCDHEEQSLGRMTPSTWFPGHYCSTMKGHDRQ